MQLGLLRLGSGSRVPILFLVVLAAAVVSYYYYVCLMSRLPFRLPDVQSSDCIPDRRALARRVMKAQESLQMLAGTVDGTELSSLVQELRAVARELDLRVDDEQNSNTPARPSGAVCPEHYRGRDVTPSFVQVPCDYVPPFPEVLTVLLSTKGWSKERIKTVVANIKKYYDVRIIVVTYGPYLSSIKLSEANVTVRAAASSVTTSSAMNEAIALVKTPFVLLTDSLTHFSGELSSLERLVRVLQNKDKVAAAAGSYRTLDGTWRHGCLQRRLENYQLAYVSGYERSLHDCMFCDDVLGPFVAHTDLLQKVPLREDVESHIALRDWLISVHVLGELAMTCPDVMFFVDETTTLTRADWLQVANKWAVQYVWPHDGGKLEFTCEELKMECVNLMKMVSIFLVPPCCRQEQRHELGLVQECGEELGLYVELQAGSLLGAVKTDGILPWDFDMDVLTDCKDQKAWMSKGRKCMSRKGCSSVHVTGNYWVSTCKVTFVDISCRGNTVQQLPPEYRSVPTRVNYTGRMITVPPNPALTARSHYGPGYLRHEVHWRYKSKNESVWNRCASPGFHACMENFPSDGNLRFKDFDHQLIAV